MFKSKISHYDILVSLKTSVESDLIRCDYMVWVWTEWRIRAIMNVRTGNEHCGNGLRGFQEVHVPPLEGLTVVGLQVTVQRKQDSLTDCDA